MFSSQKNYFSFSFYCIFSTAHIFIFIVHETMDANCTCVGNHFTIYMSIHHAVYWWFPNFLAPGTSSGEDNFFFFYMDRQGNSLGMFQGHYIYCALYFYYYYYISSTSDHQALDLRGWGPLLYTLNLQLFKSVILHN